MSKYLSGTGLNYFWTKAKEFVKSKYVAIGSPIHVGNSSMEENSLSVGTAPDGNGNYQDASITSGAIMLLEHNGSTDNEATTTIAPKEISMVDDESALETHIAPGKVSVGSDEDAKLTSEELSIGHGSPGDDDYSKTTVSAGSIEVYNERGGSTVLDHEGATLDQGKTIKITGGTDDVPTSTHIGSDSLELATGKEGEGGYTSLSMSSDKGIEIYDEDFHNGAKLAENKLEIHTFDLGARKTSTISITPTLIKFFNPNKTDNSDKVQIEPDQVSSPKIVKIGGTSSQVLLANGDVAEFNSAYGIPKLDSNGKILSSQLDGISITPTDFTELTEEDVDSIMGK